VWILQTLPAIVLGLYTRWPHRGALLGGWVAGMGIGTYMASELHFKATVFPLHLGPLTIPGYAALWALIVNFAVVILATFALEAAGVARGEDVTLPEDYDPA
jgi:solute:Na+ symporter, SSS family